MFKNKRNPFEMIAGPGRDLMTSEPEEKSYAEDYYSLPDYEDQANMHNYSGRKIA